MPRLELHKVGISFPVYSAGTRSLKNAVISASTGGRIGHDASHLVIKALEDVSMRFSLGDRVAILGHNGAGKTTLLRVMAGIFEPNVGRVLIDGRVTPLFDVTLGIDPESTGYENIILRGLYLGLSRKETSQRVD